MIAAVLFLTKDDFVEPKPKPDDAIETLIVPDDDIVIPDKVDKSDKLDDLDLDYISSDPSEPVKQEGEEVLASGEDDSEPIDTSDFPKPEKSGTEQVDEEEIGVSDWQTFHNEGYKLEINYPDTHTVYRGVPDTKVFYIDNKNNPEHNIDGILIKLADEADTAEDIIKNLEEENEYDLALKILKDETVYLFNIKVRKITVNTPMGYDSSHYFFSRNGINYELVVKNEDDLCEEIVSSFKVIN